MNIALIGYGKMGKTIERLASERGHNICSIFNTSNPYTRASQTNADVAIEFTRPDLVVGHIETAIEQRLPIVVGTTAWSAHLPQITQQIEATNTCLVHASNFSIGVNIFQQLTENLAQMLAAYPQYDLSIEEIHHLQKLDSPSGTALTLAAGIIEKHPDYNTWSLLAPTNKNELYIAAKRLPDVPGTHEIRATSTIDTITLKHEAHNRDGFALGAILAAEFALGKQGVFTMKDVLQIT
jgi:4-hydroxy-tetrahydrodipicolinate reductase